MSTSENWEADGVGGGPSSLDLLLQWLAVPGNGTRWIKSAKDVDGTRAEVLTEVYSLFLCHGITHRTRDSINRNLWKFVRQVKEADEWLKRKGRSQFDLSEETRREVGKICPYYREMAHLFRVLPMVRTQRSRPKQNVKSENGDGEAGSIHEDLPVRHEPLARSQSENLQENAVNPRWDADAENGRPSSLDVLLEWLVVPGNAWRWYKATAIRDGSRHKLSTEVYELLLSHGITYRTISGIKTKLGEQNQQLVQAEKWLESRGLRRYSVGISENMEREVLKICPHYTKIAPLFQPQSSSKTTTSEVSSSEAQTTDAREDSEDVCNSDEVIPIRDDSSGVRADTERVRSDIQYQSRDYTSTKWNADSVGGGPSSLNLLLQWLADPGNSTRWTQAAGMKGVRVEVTKEIHEYFVSHGIKHRTCQSIYSKLGHLVQAFGKADKWLKRRGLRHFGLSKKMEREVVDICPDYREITPSLRTALSSAEVASQISSNNTTVAVAGSELGYQSNDDEIDIQGEFSDAYCGTSQDTDFTSSKWDSDAVDGRPSSLNVLLKWIVTPGNAVRWQEAARKTDGSRWELASEIYDLLLTHGIAYRTPGGTDSKLRALEEQFDKAENWLLSKGIRNFQDSLEAESVVLHLCPVYPMIVPVLRSAQRSAVASTPQTSPNMEIDVRFKPTVQKLALARLSGSKRTRSGPSQPTDVAEVNPVVVLEAEPEERREFFKLELQVKRDEAVLVRAKARKELLDMGLPLFDVDRLLPL
ncbi:hypothetical protein PHYPSEUDO_009543 [Phytophthora pseudosyringae]|uniref:Uncharacterized protein n=1 Tax=Phytophthora pseudosyringae TaxID=221518 RepID=A0A8T1WNQ0_9STRA|nr:hypothetical protein PHYPSEUDO_009543 [Phytophthora pseudosyringae]